jgi:polysaccharide pyruvyl transferase WcaK-like protein
MLMRILLEPSDYILRNAGDMAMMEVAVERLRRLWPHASIEIFSDAPDRMPDYGKNVRALSAEGRRIWFASGFLSGVLRRYLPGRISRRLFTKEWQTVRGPQYEDFLRRKLPWLTAWALRQQFKNQPNSRKKLQGFLSAVSSADLVIANGMGGITDAFPAYASELLDTLSLAMRRGAVTALMGQGIGPLEDPMLRKKAAEVLPKVVYISLREDRAGGPLLKELGVSPTRVMTTGDDAIELAYSRRSSHLGSGFGLNLRHSPYAGIDEKAILTLRPLVQAAAGELRAKIVPLAISAVPEEADSETIGKLITGYRYGVASLDQEPNTVTNVIDRVRQCRIVLTGSYHAAVFALSMGIPCVGIASSAYYKDKFYGLAKMFGEGCKTLELADAKFGKQLLSTLVEAWENAPSLRPHLLQAAQRQIELGHAAYAKLFKVVEAARRKRSSAAGDRK